MTNENLKKVFNDYENINLDEMIQQYKIACSSLEHEESIRERINKIKVEWESKLIDIVNDILSNIELYGEYEEEMCPVAVGIEYNKSQKRWEIELN